MARDLVNSKKIKPPKFEAYELYIQTLNNVKTEGAYRKIIALDSSFYLARIQYLNLNIAGSEGDNLPHFEFLERHIYELSEYELAWLNYLKGTYLGNIESAFLSLNEIRLKYPKDFLLNNVTANTALSGLNNPELALSIYQELPVEESHLNTLGLVYNQRINNVIIALIQLGKMDEAVAFYSLVIEKHPKLDTSYLWSLRYSLQTKKAVEFSESLILKEPYNLEKRLMDTFLLPQFYESKSDMKFWHKRLYESFKKLQQDWFAEKIVKTESITVGSPLFDVMSLGRVDS